MTCEHCKDPDGVPMFPAYGLAPHRHKEGVIGSTEFTGEKVEGFTPDSDDQRMGVWWCPNCEEGKP